VTRNGAINIRTCGFSKDQAQTVRMIIKNQNVLHVLASGRICCRKRCRLPNDENPFRVDARLSTRKRISRETRFPIGDGPNEGCRKEHSSMVRAFPFMRHAMTDYHVVAMARAWDFVVSLVKRSLFPPSR